MYQKKLRKRIALSIFFLFLLIIGLIYWLMPNSFSNFVEVENVWSGEIATSFSGGNGTKENPYQIANGEELAYFKELIESVESKEYYNKYYILTANINMGNLEFHPIGISGRLFEGILNGQGYTITNIKIGTSQVIDDVSYLGLFTNLKNATIQNVNLDNVSIEIEEQEHLVVGLIAGSILENTTLKNIALAGNIVTSPVENVTQMSIGSISGEMVQSNLSNAFITTNITTDNKEIRVGSLVGTLTADNTLDNILIDSNIETDMSQYPTIYTLETVNDTYLETLKQGNDKNFNWVVKENEYYLERVEQTKPKKQKAVSDKITLHDSGIDGDTVYVNDIDADYNYYMGRNYTSNDGSNLPTMENKKIYDDSNLVNVQINYYGTENLRDGTPLIGTISLEEPQTNLTYYKVYPVSTNNTSTTSDDYIEIELIDNPYANRPTGYAFNGWVSVNLDYQVTLDQTYFVYKVKVPIHYVDGKPEDLVLDFQVSWTEANVHSVSNGWTTLENEFYAAGMHKISLIKRIQEPLDMTGYYLQQQASRNSRYTGYDANGTYHNNTRCSSWAGCTYYTLVENEFYNSSNTYYELRNNRMTQVSESDLNFTYHEEVEQRFVGKDMAGFYTLDSVNYNNSIDGYFNENGELQSGVCQTRNGCNVYRKIPLFDENGSSTYMNEETDYYYLVTRDTNIALLDVTVSDIWGTSFNRPFTLTSLDSGEDYRNRAEWDIRTNNVTCHNNTRIEFVRIVSSQRPGEEDPVGTTGSGWFGGGASATLFGNYFNVKLGRGITQNNNYQNFNSIIGGGTSTTGSTNNVTKYKIIIESGHYNSISLVNGTSGSRTYVEMIGVYGNDYDRVTNNNSNLDIYYCAGGAWGGDVHASSNEAFAITSIVKSGSFGTGRIDHTTGIYVGGRSGGAHYAQRRIIYEGGWTYNLIGGPLTANSRGSINDIDIAIKGGEIDAVYGGAGTTATYGNRIIQITGGKINYSVFGGSNGYNGSNGDGTLNGAGYIYIGGNAQIGNEEYVANGDVLFGMEAGSVFGIGNGRSEYATIGSSDNSYIVIDGDATILNNVYGGGNFGAVGISSDENTSETIVDILSGTIMGNVYGGGNRNGSGSTSKTSHVTINLIDGIINGSIYGGANEEGIIYGSVTINQFGGLVKNDIYGGGYGGRLGNSNGTYVRDAISIQIGDEKSNVIPEIDGFVYGGSAFGTVNGTTNTTNKSNNGISIVVNKGLVRNALFGGGKGNDTYTPYVLGDIEITINDGNIADIFGGNDAAGTPNGEINIYLNGGIVGRTFGGGNNASVNTNHIYLQGGQSTTIFGGSNASGTVTESNIFIKSGTTEIVYGGNNTAGDTITSNITVDGGTIQSAVYGGGRLATTGVTNITLNATTIPSVYGGGERADVTTSTNITQNGSTVTNLYGGSNASGSVATTNIKVEGGTTTNLFGGNNEGGSNQTSNITVNQGTITNLYGGGNRVGITTSNINLGGGTINAVYGGSNQAGTVDSTNIKTISKTSELLVGNLYGGNNLGGNTKDTLIQLEHGTYESIFGGGNEAETTGNTNVTVNNSIVNKSIYGGGNNAVVLGDTTVNVFGNTEVKASVFGGGNHGSIGSAETENSIATVNIAGATIGLNVYGGCNTSDVHGYTKVNIGKEAIENNSNITSADIKIKGTVFGGGEANESGNETYDFTYISVTQGIDILIDGTGYGKNALTFEIAGSIFGSGNASSSSGPSNVYIRKLGTRDNPNPAISIQRADTVTLDDSTIELIGTTDRTNEYSDIKYSLNRIENLKIKNNTSLLLRENANMLQAFTSLVDVNGQEELATVTIDEENETISRNVDNRLYLIAGKILNVTTNEAATSYGVVSGMTFLGMYQRYASGSYVYGLYEPGMTYDSEVSAGDVLTGGSYVLGLHNTNHDITKDGYYTNYINDDFTKLTVKYIDPTPKDAPYYMWTIGVASINYSFTLTASKYSSLGTNELSMMDFASGNTIFNVLGFNGDGLAEGIVLKDGSEVPKIANSSEEATHILGLAMKSETVEWTGYGTTEFLKDTKSSFTGDKTYKTDNQTVAPSFMFYLYHAKNITDSEELGTVVITLQAQTPKNEIEYDVQLVTITITITTRDYNDDDAYDASITYSKKYEMPSATDVNITNKSQFTAYYSLFSNKGSDAFYGNRHDYYHALVSNYVLPVGTKITMIDYGVDDTNPKYYYYIITEEDVRLAQTQLETNKEITYPLKKFIKMDSTDSNNTYQELENHNYYYHDDLNYIMEEFIFIFDFQNTDITGEHLNNSIVLELRNSEDRTMITVLGIRQNLMYYNLYESSNVLLEETIGLDTNYLYHDIAKDMTYDTHVGYEETELRQSIIDTNYESSSMGVNISFYDVNGTLVSSSMLSSTTITMDNTTYYVDANGIFRIKLADKVSNLNKNMIIMTGSSLPEGKYTMKVDLFASNDGLHNNSDKEITTKEISITVVGNDNMIVVNGADESQLIIGETGLNMNDSNKEEFTINYQSVLENPNIRVSLYKRNTESADSKEYIETDIKDLFTNTFTEIQLPLHPQSPYEYMISRQPAEKIELIYSLQEKLTSGTYKLVFKLYDGDQWIDEDSVYIIIRKNV